MAGYMFEFDSERLSARVNGCIKSCVNHVRRSHMGRDRRFGWAGQLGELMVSARTFASTFARTFVSCMWLCSLLWLALPGVAMAAPLHDVASVTFMKPIVPPIASLFHFSDSRPKNLGVKADRLAPCPATPNCVSSQSDDPTHLIAPIVTTEPRTTLIDLAKLIQENPAAKLITQADDYLYAEYTSALMGFVDDVELWANETEGVIEVRSASRLGESDLGVNRQRIETLRQQLSQNSTL